MPRAAIYCRISQDRESERGGTDRQERDCRSLCKREGLDVARVFVDDDVSAYSGKRRPAFEELLAHLGDFDALVFWKVDRLVRRVGQFFRVVDACEQAGVRLVSVIDPLDTSSPLGKGIAGMLAAMGEQESHNTSTRVQRKEADLAAAGRPHGHRRAFGYEADGMTVVTTEGLAIREARDRVLAGEAMTRIVNDWNRRGIKPTTASQWRVHGFQRMICGTRIAGLRRYRGEVVGAAAWPAIISGEDHQRIVGALGDPRTRRPRGRHATYLLSGLLRCGHCDKKLRRGPGFWRCDQVPGEEDHCGQIWATAAPVDDLVEEALLLRLDSGAVRRALRQKPTNGAQANAAAVVADLEARLVQLGIDHDNGIITRKEWLTRRGPLTDRLDDARGQLTPPERDGAEALAVLDGDVRDRWAALPFEQRRAIVAAVIDHVVINPPARRGNRFDPERVDIIWRV
jgi:DNA invertase Pin-like site-specific DNA recombinase